MDAFIKRPPLPAALFSSQDIRDRSSLFTATIYAISSPSQYKTLMTSLKSLNQSSPNPAAHLVSALRCMILKPNRTGLSGPDDFVLRTENDDDNKKFGSEKILSVMQDEGVIDAVVVVKRWFGGILLGPARFRHIETCTREVCRLFKKKEELDDCIGSILNLDGILDGLREELAVLMDSTATEKKEKKKQDYNEWTVDDLAKAKRILVAREKAVESLKTSIRKRKEENRAA